MFPIIPNRSFLSPFSRLGKACVLNCGILVFLFCAGSIGAQEEKAPENSPAEPISTPGTEPTPPALPDLSAPPALTPLPVPGSPTTLSPETKALALPSVDPATEILSWNGHSWHISNNRLFRSSFERFLNTPEETSKEDADYAALVDEIMLKLAPARASVKSIDEAFSLLAKASAFPRDANLSDAIANQVYSVWLARRSNDRLTSANRALEEERRRVEWNMKMAATSSGLRSQPSSSKNQVLAEWARQESERQKIELQPLSRRLMEINALLKIQETKREISIFQSKIEFQALILQLFLQRRFDHVLIATRFYRNIFADGDQQIKLGEEGKNFFARTTGLPPTVTTVDAIANEAIRNTEEGVQAFQFLIASKELDSASNRLAEAFIVGEHLRPIRTLPRTRKREILEYYRKKQDLITALDVRAYDRAAELVNYLVTHAGDFDPTRAKSAIDTANNVASMHLAKAKNAASSGDKETFETELKEATVVWPTNPELKRVANQIFERTDLRHRSLIDFDQLVSQRNHRRIFEEQARFIAATIDDSTRQEQLQKILAEVHQIDSRIAQAEEIERRGDAAGAWETIDRTFQEFPEDTKLGNIRSSLTTKVSAFVSAMEKARTMEEHQQIANSLSWYLNAQKIYPASEYAQDGIQRLIKKFLPDAS